MENSITCSVLRNLQQVIILFLNLCFTLSQTACYKNCKLIYVPNQFQPVFFRHAIKKKGNTKQHIKEIGHECVVSHNYAAEQEPALCFVQVFKSIQNSNPKLGDTKFWLDSHCIKLKSFIFFKKHSNFSEM